MKQCSVHLTMCSNHLYYHYVNSRCLYMVGSKEPSVWLVVHGTLVWLPHAFQVACMCTSMQAKDVFLCTVNNQKDVFLSTINNQKDVFLCTVNNQKDVFLGAVNKNVMRDDKKSCSGSPRPSLVPVFDCWQ